MSDHAWTGCLAFGPWWLLYSGPVGPTDCHAHHAYQLVVHAGLPVVVDGTGTSMVGPIVVVEPDVRHAFSDVCDDVLIAYIDPESDVGRQLHGCRIAATPVAAGQPISSVAGASPPDNWSRAEEAVQRIVAAVCQPSAVTPMSWWRHPAIDAALARLPALADDGAIDVSDLAAEVGLSVSRLTHVFSEEVGTPIRSYVRWMRLVTATERLAEGVSITEAAHGAGFSDGAHFSRTFRSMFGLSPSEAVGLGTWLT